MPRINKQETAEHVELPIIEGHYGTVGDFTVGFERYFDERDVAAVFRGLPDDACQCPHWGVVLKGRLTFTYTDGTVDDLRAGDAYYARPGHTPTFHPDTEVVEFSPTAELEQTMAVVMGNVPDYLATLG